MRAWMAIEGWEISYFEPTYGMHGFTVHTHAALAEATAWLEAGGFMYRIREVAQ